MFPPPGLAITLLSLLQHLLSLLNFDLPDLHPILRSGNCYPCNHSSDSGGALRDHGPSIILGVSADLPDDCTVVQVISLHGHGSRGLAKGLEHILTLVDTLDNAWNIIQVSNLPPDLEFLKEGYHDQLLSRELALVSRKQLVDHGTEFAHRYPTFWTDVVVSTTDERIIESAYLFGQGFLGREAKGVTFATTEDFKDLVSWLAPWQSCPKLSNVEPFQEYIPLIVERLNKLIPGIEFSCDDIRGALEACVYGFITGQISPWCHVFTAHELQRYELDLFLEGHIDRLSRGDPELLGAFYVKKLIERLTNTTKDAKPLHLEFGHEYSILFPLSTMGLDKNTTSLSPDHMPGANHTFKGPYQAPFAAEMVWEKFTCKETFQGPQVRLMLDGAVFPLSICERTDNDKKYGTCSLDAFVRENEYSMNVEYGSEIWNATCELGR